MNVLKSFNFLLCHHLIVILDLIIDYKLYNHNHMSQITSEFTKLILEMMMIFLNKTYRDDVLITLLIYIITYKDFVMYISCYCEIYKKYKILSIVHLKLCSLNLIVCHNKGVYSSLSECIHLINNFMIFYVFNDVCLHIVINVKHIEKTNNFKKHLKNCIHKCKLTINDYKI